MQVDEFSMSHFLDLAKAGKTRPESCSSGELCASRLSVAVLEYALRLDDDALNGLLEFIRVAHARPSMAIKLLAT